VEPESDEQWAEHEAALRRREMRLILAGRLKSEDATLVKLLQA
jgi:hypothetical protein